MEHSKTVITTTTAEAATRAMHAALRRIGYVPMTRLQARTAALDAWNGAGHPRLADALACIANDTNYSSWYQKWEPGLAYEARYQEPWCWMARRAAANSIDLFLAELATIQEAA